VREPPVVGAADGETENDIATHYNSWLTRTRWPTTYTGVRRDILVKLTQLPDRRRLNQDYNINSDNDGRTSDEDRQGVYNTSYDEQRIACLLDAVGRVLERCEDTVRHTGEPLLRWLNSCDPLRSRVRPFQLPLLGTRLGYVQVWKRCLAFVFRYYRMPAEARRYATKGVVR
jgi:hypothetical protein